MITCPDRPGGRPSIRATVLALAAALVVVPALDGEMGQGPVQATGLADSGYTLTGTRTQVAYGPVADAFLVPAETDSGVKVFLAAAADPGVTVTSLDTTGHGSVAHMDLQGVTIPASGVSLPAGRQGCPFR